MNTSFIVPENIITEIHNHTFHANQLLQNEYLWQLSYSKSLRSRNLIKYFSDINLKYLKTKVFIVGKTLANTHIELNDEYTERRLNSTDIANPSYDLIQDLGGSIVFITSGETDTIDKRNSQFLLMLSHSWQLFHLYKLIVMKRVESISQDRQRH